ncbi:hypothetical protein CC85DRAFT_283016 [Cutaneotrichosporon oleaginosum]|uniref:FK506-binding protein n=1 Tax=Cutaneotrichosporon oleaginosum TaxID=879819 RepID=A0A0J0XVK3_9TREE|nr:uncharacterized protein CC85DRAFT_283016 [Cutaneotrichosporon oleaginosum]KLT45102.1 hypothetical protein CC85DRAFT_283016 [Cutaneotrichosporon oleaginosum]TXT09783.1 hypothetical protein COLE_03717 [Cutaneotrichosporon oleaginosum]
MSPLQLNLWSLTLEPGVPVPIYVRRDFQLTNAALAEELDSETARTVVKVTHSPIPQHIFDSDDEDDEYDEDDMVVGSDEESDEDDELDEDEDDEMGEDEDEDDEDDSEGSEGSDDDDFEDVAEEIVLCALTPGRIEQAQLNITFIEGELVILQTNGPNAVHLLGNYIYQGGESDSEDDEDYSDGEYSDLDDRDEFDIEEFAEDIEEAPKGKITAVEDEVEKPKPKAKTFAAVVADKADTPKSEKVDKKRKAEEISETPTKAEGELSRSQKKKLAKKAKVEADGAPTESPAPKKEAKKETKEEPKKDSKKKTLPSGLVIEDIKVGTGPVAKGGKRLGMRYIGKLENGKQFDANTGGKPFNFVLGRGEVIAGWDQGLVGMAVGGERRLTIPAKLAYGSQRIPGIPPNSTLKFDVKLVSVN